MTGVTGLGADRFVADLDPATVSKHVGQRYAYGISEIDMWNFDKFFADVIVAGCEWHLKFAQTTPWHLERDAWQEVLEQIRDGFSRVDSFGAPNPPKRAWKLLRKHYRNFWD